MNRLLKKKRKKDSAKHREAYRLFTSDGENAKEATNGGEAAGDASADGKVIKIDKGLAQMHKEHELDHLDHDSHSGEDKFVKMIWDKGDGFVKRWHWDRGEKVKENHSVAAKKHLEHHDKGKVDEHVEKQQGVVVHSKNNESSETNGIEKMAKSSISRDQETKNDDIIEQLKLKLLKQRLQQQQQQSDQKGGQSIVLDGAQAAKNNENSDNDDVNGDNRIELLLGNQDSGEEADSDDNDINNHGLRRQNQYKEIIKKDDKNEDEPRSKARRFPVRKQQRNKNENDENNESDDSGDNGEGNKIKKHRDYHRKVTVREEKSELAAQERYRTGDKNNDEINKENDENNGDEGGNGYESGSKGSGYIKHYQLTSDGQKRSLNPLDFSSIIGDQSLQIKTAVAQDNGKIVDNKNEVKPSEKLDNTSLTRKRLLTQNHFQPNTLQLINPR
uniref:Uncharacterized protein n=2 Tax=Tetranychus urticae TaxID=32264 RepID=T1L393_TETUR